jgi:hypothetical protein
MPRRLTPIAMGKSPTLIESVKSAHDHRPGAARAGTKFEWSDAETRAFLERPGYSPPFAKILQVILITAMMSAGLKIAWLLLFQA